MSRRNVLVLLCDQLRRDFLPIYGCAAVPTPNLDRIAARGVVFDNAITQSTVCAPARASMMTGRYVSDHGVWTNDVPFAPGLELLPELMATLGYRTGAFGKLHHFPAGDGKGFNHLRQMEEGRLGDEEPYLVWLQQRHPEVTRLWNHADYEFAFAEEEYYEHWIASEAIGFIGGRQENAAPDRQPFLAWVSFQGPHSPIDPPREAKGTVDESALPRPTDRRPNRRPVPDVVRYRTARDGNHDAETEVMRKRVAYAEQIVAIDRQIGRLLDHLEACDLMDSTTIVFSADHGDLLGDFRLNAKGPFPYPAQMDIPLVVANHPDLRPGTRSAHLAGNIDIAGTVLQAAGADRSIGYSRSLIELAREDAPNPREVIYSEFCDSVKTVDDGRFRYSYYPFQEPRELFDRHVDPFCLDNLAGDPVHAEREARMLAHIVDFLVVAKGVRSEAQDFVPAQQEGLRKKHPDYARDFPVAFPLSAAGIESLKAAGLDTSYNEFCRGRPLVRSYGQPYWGNQAGR